MRDKVSAWLLKLSCPPPNSLPNYVVDQWKIPNLADHHTLALHKSSRSPLKTFADRYYLYEKLGSGKHGQVWLGLVLGCDEQRVAIKILHDYKKRTRSFYSEVNLYQALWGTNDLKGFAHLQNTLSDKKSGKTGLVLDDVGINLDELFRLYGKRWCITTVGRLWLMLIDRIEAVHRCGFVLRYIKGANLCMGGEDFGTLFLVDFAGSKRYLDEFGKHVPCQNNVRPSGNAAFRSVKSDQGITPSRRDDLESAAYAMLAFIDSGRLPWSKRTTDLHCKKAVSWEKISRGYAPIHRYLGE